jgi:SAM-dependent methyltransferase
MTDPKQLFGDGQAYERQMGRWSRLAGQQFLDWLDVPKGLTWLDAGCGNGAFTETIIERCAPARIEAIDPSEGQLAYARTQPGVKMATFQRGDAQQLPFPDASFDVAAMGLVITFIPDPAKAVRELTRVTRPGGLVATYMWDIPSGGLPLEPIHGALQALGMPGVRPPGSEASRLDAMQAFWEQAGLRRIETRVIRIDAVYSDFDDFWVSNGSGVGPAGQAIRALPPASREQLQAILRQRLLPRPDGCIVREAFANAVKGRVPE